jgi:hypothetical protein
MIVAITAMRSDSRSEVNKSLISDGFVTA